MNTDRLGNYSGELRPPIPRPNFVATRFERTEWRREGIRTSVPVAKGPVSVAEGELPEWSNGGSLEMRRPSYGDRGFESISLHRRVCCELTPSISVIGVSLSFAVAVTMFGPTGLQLTAAAVSSVSVRMSTSTG